MSCTNNVADGFSYPLARRVDLEDDYHGNKVPDPYRHLEDPDSEETKAYVEKLNAVSGPFLTGCKFRENIKEKLTKLWDYPKISCLFREGDNYFYYHNSGLQNQSVLYTQDSLSAEPTVFFDPNLLSDDGTTSISLTAFTHDGTLLAYGLSEKGSDWSTARFKKVPGGEDLPDVLKGLRYSSLCWTHDNRGVFYNAYPGQKGGGVGTNTTKNEFHTLYYHVLGTPQSEDILCYDFPDHPQYMIVVDVTEDGRYLVCNVDRGCDPTNLLFYYELAQENGIKGRLSLKPIIEEFVAKFDVIANDGPIFTVITNKDAPLFKLIQIDITNPSEANWKTLVEEKPKAKLDWAALVSGDKLILCYMEDVKNTLQVHSAKTGEKLYTIPLDMGEVVELRGKPRFSEVFFKFGNFLTPGTIYRIDLAVEQPKPEVYRQTEVKGIDIAEFNVRQVFYPSRDGTKVPMYIVHRKNIELNGTNALVLYGYGGFNIPIMPSFRISRLMFIQNLHGVFAIANIRGGSEYGEEWHTAGMKEKKQKVFDDFIAAAEYLIQEGYTSRERLAIEGGSNGGLLVAACANQRPDLFGCVINHVGVLDMLRYQNFTIGAAWVPEFGCAKNEEDFKYLMKYSPLHNLSIPDCGYPAMLLLTADHDDRVVPLHSLKYIAQLYHLIEKSPGKQKKPILIRVDTKAGHGAGKPILKTIEEITEVYSFIARVMNLDWHA